MTILNTGWTLPYNAVNVFCVIGSVVAIGILIALIGVGITEGFNASLIALIIAIALVVTTTIALLICDKEKTYDIYLDDMTLKELETEYEPYRIDGLVVKCTKKGVIDGIYDGTDNGQA